MLAKFKILALIATSHLSMYVTLFYVDKDFYVIMLYTIAFCKLIKEWRKRNGCNYSRNDYRRIDNSMVSSIRSGSVLKY